MRSHLIARVALLLVLPLLAAGTTLTDPATPVRYTVSPVMDGDSLRALVVEIRMDGDADGETRLEFPGEWAGADSLWRFVDDVRAEGAAMRQDGVNMRVLTHAVGAPITVRYRVLPAYTAEPGLGYKKALPIITPDWFFFHGEGVIATPVGRGDAPATFAWGAFPAGWRIASDLDHVAGGQPAAVDDIVESASLGSPSLALARRDIDGKPLRLAMRGAWSFGSDVFADRLQAIINAENAFWGDAGRPFVITLAGLGATNGGYSYVGTGRVDGFSVAATDGFELDRATRFLAHEYMHTWIAAELGGPFDVDEALGNWFSEGFTDFYAARTLLRSGVWTVDEFAADVNVTLMRNGISPVRTLPNGEMLARFWSDQNVHQLPYDRGNLLAMLLDDRIRRHTGGRLDMDDVMLAQRRIAARNSEAGRRTPAATLFPEVVRSETGLNVADLIARHVERGEAVMLPADLYGACGRVETTTQPVFDRGWDAAATNAAGGIIAGTDPAGPAYAAGMRDGMRYISREAGEPGNSAVELVYRVRDESGERTIRYYPRGTGSITLQRLVLSPNIDRAACARIMSGG